jgi:hypothetical protein
MALSRNFALASANALSGVDCFPLHGRGGVAGRGAFEKILAQKGNNSAESFVLSGVDEFMRDEMSILPAIRPNENAVTQSQSARRSRDKIRSGARSF